MKVSPIPKLILDAIRPTQEALDGQQLEKFKALLLEPDAAPERFFRLLPPASILALMFAAPGNLDADLPELIKNAAKPLTELIAQELPALDRHPAFRRAFVAAMREANAPDADMLANLDVTRVQPKTIVGIATMQMLTGENIPLIPTHRLVLQFEPGREIKEIFATAHDLAYLASAFTEGLATMLSQRAHLAADGVVHIPSPAQVAGQIADLERAVATIKQFAPAFGINLAVPAEVPLP